MTAGTRTSTNHRGRPRDPHCDEAIIAATLDLVAEAGYDRASLDAIAARAGVSKPTIYRRWPKGKDQLVAAAIQQCRESSSNVDTGTLRGDLIASVEQLIEGMREHADLAAGLAQRLRDDPELASAFREQIVAATRERFAAVVDRAVERGELSRRPRALGLLGDIAPSVVHSRAFITGDPLDRRFAKQLVDSVLIPALNEGG